MCAMTVSKLMSTCGNNSCASGGDGRCASNGAFSTGVPVDWGLSQQPARVDCGLSYTTGRLWLVMFKCQSAFVHSDRFMRNFMFNLPLTYNGSRDILHSDRKVQVRANLVIWCMLSRGSMLKQVAQLSYRRGTARRLKSVEILSAAAQLYEKSHLTRRIALSCGIKNIAGIGSLE